MRQFQDDKACMAFLCEIRWKAKMKCPYCNGGNISKHQEKDRRDRLQCSGCRKSFSPTVNTILHKTHIPLFKWFLAISLLSEAKKSISSRQLARHLSLPVKTAYSLSQRIRKALLGTRSPLLKGIIELDETYIGGKPRFPNTGAKRGRGTKKTLVVGMLERGGSVINQVEKQYRKKQVRDMVLQNADVEKSSFYTDDYGAYNQIGRFAPHESVNHSMREYVRGDVHTNTIEGYWALVKRAWYGQHHHYTKKYTPLYIAESSFKYNNRKLHSSEVFNKIMDACINS
ncbi:MAG: IS1595 family transposase [Candidatus Omnitrophota bacterium]|nr:IS1595 family transposase [Candidatus Omnitrophota bacterium]